MLEKIYICVFVEQYVIPKSRGKHTGIHCKLG